MKNPKIIIFSPPYHHLGTRELYGQSGREDWFPLGAFSITNALRLAGNEHTFLYYQEDHSPRTLERLIKRIKPDIVGISCFSLTRFACLDLAKRVKKIDRDTLTILGGTHPSFLDKQIMTNYPFIDMVLRGYGETAFPDIADAFSRRKTFDGIPGLSWRDKGRWIRNRDGQIHDELSLPLAKDMRDAILGEFPSWISRDMISHTIPVETARGCPYHCFFCSKIEQKENRVIDRDPGHVLKYIKGLFKLFGPRPIYFCAPNFTLNKKKALALCRALKRSKLQVQWTCGTRIDLIDKELLLEMKTAGCQRIYYGVDSLCQRLLHSIHRDYTPEKAVRDLNLTVACGLACEANLLIGFPGEDRRSLSESLLFLRKIDPKVSVVVRPLKIMPGSQLYHKAIEEGFDETYWLKDHGTDFPDYTGSLPAKELVKYCRTFNEIRRRT